MQHRPTRSSWASTSIRDALRAIFLALLFAAPLAVAGEPQLREGDVVFQTSRSAQSEAIRLATHSRWSHVGLVLKKDGRLQVLEAVQPVRYTPLAEWIARGEGGHVVARRLRDEKLLNAGKLATAGGDYLGKNYDLAFSWSDDRIYCSELVWKLYKAALGIELSPLKTLREFDLSAPAVQAKLKERYGKQFPLNEKVVSPEDLYRSELLVTIFEK